MALQYSGRGEVASLILAEPPRRDRRAVALDNFISTFAVQFELRAKGVPTDPEFCPIRTTAVVETFLRQVTQSLPLVLLRVRVLLKRARMLQAWFRRILKTRNDNIQQIFERWVSADAGHKKALRTELYRDSRICPAAFRNRLRTYAKLHNPKEAMYATILDLYWNKREEFHRQFRPWNTALNATLREQQRLRGLLRQARKGGVVVRSEGMGPGSRRPGEESAVLVGTLELRLTALQEEIVQMMARRPRFSFTVKTVSRSELVAAVCRPRPLSILSARREGSSPEIRDTLSDASEKLTPTFSRCCTWTGQEDVLEPTSGEPEDPKDTSIELPRLASPLKRERGLLSPPSFTPQAMRMQFLSGRSVSSSDLVPIPPPSRGGIGNGNGALPTSLPPLGTRRPPTVAAAAPTAAMTAAAAAPVFLRPVSSQARSITPRTPSSPHRHRKLCALMAQPSKALA